MVTFQISLEGRVSGICWEVGYGVEHKREIKDVCGFWPGHLEKKWSCQQLKWGRQQEARVWGLRQESCFEQFRFETSV